MSPRVEKLKHKLDARPPAEMCFERARLMTRSYRETEGEPAILRRAKAFATVLDGLPIDIAPDELIVGNVASRPRVAYFAPETFNWRNYRTGSVHEWSDHRFSKSLNIRARIPDGRLAGEALSVCLGPSRGADRRGPTAMLKSVARLKWEHQVGGALIHIRMPLGALEGEESLSKLVSLVKTFFLAGGMGLHFTVVHAAMLREAQEHPERHAGLLVRVGGFSAPFVLLSRDIQENIIQRTEHGLDDSGGTSPMSG